MIGGAGLPVYLEVCKRERKQKKEDGVLNENQVSDKREQLYVVLIGKRDHRRTTVLGTAESALNAAHARKPDQLGE